MKRPTLRFKPLAERVAKRRTELHKRFQGSYMKDPSGCWLWSGSTHNGYGMLGIRDATIRAHRASWELHKGSIPENMLVLHKCDTPPCVNPEHLFLGTHQDNVADKVSKFRQTRGEDQPRSKLTEKQVLQIRIRYEALQRELAQEFGVKRLTIFRIIRRQRWKHV